VQENSEINAENNEEKRSGRGDLLPLLCTAECGVANSPCPLPLNVELVKHAKLEFSN
jgi:hypothetical protein